ncbi:MAG: hypothetical protein NT002_12390 [candidate division Zixibacteria bacterium]|nr:hypothetical protein [candidate division Zixibacteria bacterium]
MFDGKGLKKLQKLLKKTRQKRGWNSAPKKELEKKLNETKENRQSPRRLRDEDKMDLRDILMEEGDESLHGG